MEHVADWAWTLDFPRTRRGALLAKRVLDVIASGALLVLISPVLILVIFVVSRLGRRKDGTGRGTAL